MTYYITRGGVRGQCSHKHRTLAGARLCLLRDQRGCEKVAGYSDRSIYAVDEGRTRPLDPDEFQFLDSGK